MSQPPKQLNWALVISTYKRELVLPRCLRLAAQQSLPPKEIIVVDASPYWEDNRTHIMNDLVPQYPSIEWKYIQAKRAALPAQRNQGIELATADILFLIDDDSFMYPDCAEEIMQAYTRDTEGKVIGMMCTAAQSPPDVEVQAKGKQSIHFSEKFRRIKIKLCSSIVKYLDKLTSTEHIFIPYNFRVPEQQLPNVLKGTKICPIFFMQGAYMTFRRSVFEHVHFEEILMRYAPHEDFDMCCRVFHLGVLVHNLNARIYHLEAPGGRVSRYTRAVFWGLNLAVLHRLHSVNSAHSEKLVTRLLWRTLINRTLKDILGFYWSLPSTRGFFLASKYYKKIFSMTPEELRSWYPEFQRNLF